MAAAPATRYQVYYATAADPYGANPEVLQDTYAPEVARTPTLFGATITTTYPLLYVVGSSGGRVYPIVAPFDQPVLPGQGVPRKYALIGDISTQGNLPPLLELTNEHFHITANQLVPPVNEMANRWQTAPAGEHYLGVETQANGGENVRTRNMVPVPHRYAGAILASYDAGTLNWRWLWENVGELIAQDPQDLARYQHFLNFLRVSSTRRAGAAVGDAPRLPASCIDIQVSCLVEVITYFTTMPSFFLPSTIAFFDSNVLHILIVPAITKTQRTDGHCNNK